MAGNKRGAIEPSLMQALVARMRDRTKNLQNFLEERAKKESDGISTISTELATKIHVAEEGLDLLLDSEQNLPMLKKFIKERGVFEIRI